MESSNKQQGSLFTFKNFIILMVILSFAPALIKTVQKYIGNIVSPNTHVGCLQLQGALMDSTFYVKHLEKFLKNKQIKALLIKIKSPGGLPGTSQTLFNELLKFREKKPVVALIEDIGASAAYYVAAATNTIVANPSALVGSIGARMMTGNIKELLTYHKIDFSEIAAGKFKTTTSFLKAKTPEEIAYLQNIVDDSYHQFVSDVAGQRKLDLDKKDIWANGKIFTGNKAKELNLIDKLGSISEAKEELSRLIVDRGETVEGSVKLIYPQQPSAFARLFMSDSDQGGEESDSFSTRVAGFLMSVYGKIRTEAEVNTVEMR